jgi:hypothetical protein
MTDTQARINGNYFLGLDMLLLRFPRGLIKQEISKLCYTVDKSPVRIRAVVLARLVPASILELYYAYGMEYGEVMRGMAEEYLSEAVENYTILELVMNRTDIENSIVGHVKRYLEKGFPYIYVDHVSLGELGTDIANTAVFTENPTYWKVYVATLEELLRVNKQLAFLMAGGDQILKTVEESEALMFKEITALIAAYMPVPTTGTDLTPEQKLGYAWYIMSQRLSPGSTTIQVAL